jgi:hypothetical protein
MLTRTQARNSAMKKERGTPFKTERGHKRARSNAAAGVAGASGIENEIPDDELSFVSERSVKRSKPDATTTVIDLTLD